MALYYGKAFPLVCPQKSLITISESNNHGKFDLLTWVSNPISSNEKAFLLLLLVLSCNKIQ